MIIREIDFPIYNIIIGISILIGILYIIISLYNEKLLDKKIIIFFIMFFIFSILGGKLFTYVSTGFKKSFLDSGLSSYGGLISVVIASIIYEKIYPTKNKVIKYTILSLPLIYSFTKIGCSLVGCCHGIAYDGIFNVTYPHRQPFSLFPVQPLEVIIFFILFLYVNTNKNRKDITYITLLSISIIKYAIEFLRYSETTSIMNPNQIFSIILVIITLIFYFRNK